MILYSLKSIPYYDSIVQEYTNILILNQSATGPLQQITKRVTLNNCHNSWIHNNHYRTQSEEFLRGVKEVRGGGVHKNKYKKFNSHKRNIYGKKCQLLKNKRRDLINKCLTKDQIKPQIHTDSSFFKENNKKK